MIFLRFIIRREKLESEVASEISAGVEPKAMPKTTQLVNGLLERLNLLLHVTIAPEGGGLTRSVSHMPEKTASKFLNQFLKRNKSMLWHHIALSQFYHDNNGLFPYPVPNVMVRSDTDVLKATPGYTRSMSAPLDILEAVDDSIIDIMKLQRLVTDFVTCVH